MYNVHLMYVYFVPRSGINFGLYLDVMTEKYFKWIDGSKKAIETKSQSQTAVKLLSYMKRRVSILFTTKAC